MCPTPRLPTVKETTCKEDGMDTQTIDRARVQGLAGTAARWAAVIAAAALAACGTPRAAAAAPAGSSGVVRTFTYYAFDVNHGPADPGFIPAPGTNSKVFSQGDELIINDQLTTTHQVNGGYPIVGHDAGVCTLTRIPDKHRACRQWNLRGSRWRTPWALSSAWSMHPSCLHRAACDIGDEVHDSFCCSPLWIKVRVVDAKAPSAGATHLQRR